MVNWLGDSEASPISHSIPLGEPKLYLERVFGRVHVILEEEGSVRSHLEIDELERIVDLLIQEGSQGKNIKKLIKKWRMDIQTRIEKASILLLSALSQLKENGYRTESLVARIEAVKNKLYQTMNGEVMFNMECDLPFLNSNTWSSNIERTLFGKDEPWLEVIYSHQLKKENPEKYRSASEEADQSFPNGRMKTFRWAQIFLETYYGKSIELRLVRILHDHKDTNRYLHFYGWKSKDERK